jgi:hypothetical protein
MVWGFPSSQLIPYKILAATILPSPAEANTVEFLAIAAFLAFGGINLIRNIVEIPIPHSGLAARRVVACFTAHFSPSLA